MSVVGEAIPTVTHPPSHAVEHAVTQDSEYMLFYTIHVSHVSHKYIKHHPR